MDALCATSPLALLIAPPIGFKHFRSCIFAYFERLKDFDVWNSGPSLLADLDQLGLSMAHFAVHLVDFELARLPYREVLRTKTLDNTFPICFFGSGSLHISFSGNYIFASTIVDRFEISAGSEWQYVLNSSPIKLKFWEKFNHNTI